MKYLIQDFALGLFADFLEVEANSPKQAVEKAGYTEIKRTSDSRDPRVRVIVKGPFGSYLYRAKLTPNVTEAREAQERRKQREEEERRHAHFLELIESGYLPAGTSYVPLESMNGRKG